MGCRTIYSTAPLHQAQRSWRSEPLWAIGHTAQRISPELLHPASPVSALYAIALSSSSPQYTRRIRAVTHPASGRFSSARHPWCPVRWSGLTRASGDGMVGDSAGGRLPIVPCIAYDLPNCACSGALRIPAVQLPCCSTIDSSIPQSLINLRLFQTPASKHGAKRVLYARHPSSTSTTGLCRMGAAWPASSVTITGRGRRVPRPEWLDSIVPHGTHSRCVLRNARVQYLHKCACIFQTFYFYR